MRKEENDDAIHTNIILSIISHPAHLISLAKQTLHNMNTEQHLLVYSEPPTSTISSLKIALLLLLLLFGRHD